MAANGALDARRELIDKWDRRHRQASDSGRIAEVLEQNLHLLPETGSDALDLACGRGANAILLAQQGMRVRAWDFSPEAIAVVERAAREAGVELIAECRDVIDQPPRPATFDIIVVSFFLERCLVSPIVQALRPGGFSSTRPSPVTRYPRWARPTLNIGSVRANCWSCFDLCGPGYTGMRVGWETRAGDAEISPCWWRKSRHEDPPGAFCGIRE